MLIVAAHGTASAAGLATFDAITASVRALRPSLSVSQAYLDVAEPSLVSVVAALAGPAVVVPLLLSGGYHVHSDIPSILRDHPEVTASVPLGPDPAIAGALADRLAEARDRVAPEVTLLVAAGSSDPSARHDVEVAAGQLQSLLGRPVEVAVLSGPGRTIADVAALRSGRSIEIATYLLAPGLFATKLARQAAEAGIDTVSAPIGAHPAVVALVLDRYDTAVGALSMGPEQVGNGARGGL